MLRATRLRHGLTIADVAAALRIRKEYLEAIETGRSERLPAPAYTLGYVRSYASALGLDAEEVLRRYRAEAGLAQARKPDLSFPAPVPERGVPAGALVVIGLVLAAGLYGGWYYLTDTGQRLADVIPPVPERLARFEPQPPSPSAAPATPPVGAAAPGPLAALPPPASPPAQASGQSPAPPPLPPQSPSAPTPAAAPPAVTLPPNGAWPTGPAVTALPSRRADPSAANAAPVVGAADPPQAAAPAEPPAATYGASGAEASSVLLRARADTWIQVRERGSGTVLFNRVLRPGETYRVPDRGGLLLTTGNAGGLEVVVAGDALPTLGGPGVVRRDLPLEPEALRQLVAALPR